MKSEPAGPTADPAERGREEAMMRILRASFIAAMAMLVVGAPAATSAVNPSVARDHGAYVRIVGNPADGTLKFQYGWAAKTDASDAMGYWVGVYDVTNSHYEWAFDTGEMDMPAALFMNARPTSELPNGEYKVNFFVRATYVEPVTNLAEIELPFTVSHL